MTGFTVEPGRLCFSKCGRDQGRYFIIKQQIDENYVYIIDGMLRKVASPKKKKLKHLELKPEVFQMIQEKLVAGTKVFDQEIASAIIGCKYNRQ